MPAPPPHDEPARLDALRRYAILDTPAEQAFDDLAFLAAHLCDAPMAYISFVDAGRLWLKSRVGLTANELARDRAFCAYAILQSEVLVVPDALADPRFATHPLVTFAPKIRSYAGAPLVTPDGHVLGTICILDRVPRRLSQAQTDALQALARQGIALLELRRRDAALASAFVERGQTRRAPRGTRDASAQRVKGQRQRAAAALSQSETRFRELFDEAPVGYHELDAQGRITRINRTELAMLGYTAEEMLGRPVWEFVQERDVSRQAFAIKIARGEPGHAFERTLLRKDGTTVPVLIEDRLLRDADDRIVGVRSTVQDISERKRLEQQLLHAQKMEAVGRLASGVAHDFNNLLTVIMGFSSLIGKRPTTDAHRRYADQIVQTSQRAATLARQLLAFSRQQALAPQVLDLNAVVTGTERLLRRLIGEDVSLVTVLAPDLGRVRADPGQLDQVLMNLAVNARDAMPRGGTLTIETANVELDEAYARGRVDVRPGPYVRLTVRDTGCGMDADTQSHLFEPFFTTKGPDKGTGLGLSTVYGIVTQSGGHTEVESAPGHGATFHIYLPRVEAAAALPDSGATATDSSRGTETILLVEDEATVRAVAHGVLEAHGYTVLAASNGEEALRLVERHLGPLHLLLTDVVLPGMSGGELAVRLTSLLPELKVLYISGYTDEMVTRYGVLPADVPFLQKPFTPDGLAGQVRIVLDAPAPIAAYPARAAMPA